MSPPTSQFERRLRSVTRRLRATRALEEGARFGLLAAPLGLGAAVARTFMPHGALASMPPRDALAIVLAPAALGALAGAIGGALALVSRERAAALAEDRAKLGAAFTTAIELGALELGAEVPGGEHAWRPLVLAEAEALARTLEPGAVAPLHLPRRTRTLVLVVATALAVFFLPVEKLRASPPEPEKTVTKDALDAVAKAGSQLRQASEALPAGESRRAVDEAGKQLRTFVSEAEQGELGRRDALARLGDAEERLRVERAKEEARSSVREALAKDQDLAKLAKAGGGTGAPDKQKLDALAKKLASDPRAREAAKEALQAAAQGAEATPELKESLERAARALDGARTPEDAAKLAPALQDLARAMAEQPSTEQDKAARTELAKAHRALEEARAAVTGEKPPAAPASPAEEPANLAEKIPPELLAKALEGTKKPEGSAPSTEKPGEKGADNSSEKPPISPEDAKKLLDKLPPETLEKLAKAAQEGAKDLPEEVKKDVQEAQKKAQEEAAAKPPEKPPQDGEEKGIPPEALAKMAEMIPPELLAKAMKMKAESDAKDPQGGEGAPQPPISPEDAQKVLEKLSPKTLEKLAKAALEAQKNAPPPREGQGGAPREGQGGMSPEQAQEIAKKLSPETIAEIKKAAGAIQHPGGAPRPGTGTGTGPGTGTAPGTDSGTAGVLGRQGDAQTPPETGDPKDPPRVLKPGEPEGPKDDKDPLVKNRPQVRFDTAPEKLPSRERDVLRATLERKRVPRSYERSVREYFDLGKP